MKTFSSKSNARRAAVKAMGADAVAGVDFTFVQKGTKWGFVPGSKAPAESATPPAKPKAAAKPKTPKKPGVITTAIAVLRQAPAKGLTAQEIAERVVKKLPNRVVEKVLVTVRTQVPSQLTKKGYSFGVTRTKGQPTQYTLKGEPNG